MGVLMADDRDLIIGELRGGVQAIKEHLDRQDKQRDTDKAEAIQAREERHADNVVRFNRIEEKATQTYGMASAAYNWVDEKGGQLIEKVERIEGRVSAIEQAGIISAAESRGKKAAYGVVGAAIGSAVTFMTGMDGELIEKIKRVLHLG